MKYLQVYFFISIIFSFQIHAISDPKPNIIFIVIDDLNSWPGNPQRPKFVKSPHIDRLASRSINFTNAHCSAPVCVASRASFMSGVHPSKSGLYTNAGWKSAHEVISETPHLVELIKNSGYTTLGAGKIYHNWVSDTNDIKLKPILPLLHDKFYDRYLDMEAVMPVEKMFADGEGYGMQDTGRGNIYYPFPEGGTRLGKELAITRGTSLCAGPVLRSKMKNGKMPDEVIADWGIKELKRIENKPSDKPFFMALGFIRPHVPFSAPKEYFDLFPLDSITLPKTDNMKDIPLYGKAMTMGLVPGGDHAAVEKLGEQFWKELIQGYLASIAFVDDQIGRVLSQLKNSGLDKNTMIILISDHGQNLGEKKNWRKMSLWEESTKVPFIVKMPKSKQAGTRVKAAVSLLDIYPTILDLLKIQAQAHADGSSLVPMLNNPKIDWDKPVLSSWFYKNFSVRSNRYRYIQYRDGSEELYDHKVDPKEHKNLASKAEYKVIIDKLKTHIPNSPALPYGKSESKDNLDELVKQFQEAGLPTFLK